MSDFEKQLNKLPCQILKVIQEPCPFGCGGMHKRQIKYVLKIDVSQKDEEKRYKIYYYSSDIFSGRNDKYIGDPCGLGFKTLNDALNDLIFYLKRDKYIDECKAKVDYAREHIADYDKAVNMML